jgi:dihydrofolate reductase
MRYRIIAAIDENGGMGYRGGLPFQLREDIRYFRKQVEGGIIVGTRLTVNQVGKPPMGSRVWGVSRTPDLGPYWERVYTDWRSAAQEANAMGEIPWIIGGEWLFREALRGACELWLTLVEGVYPADRYFPAEWKDWFSVTLSCEQREENGIRFVWLRLAQPAERTNS